MSLSRKLKYILKCKQWVIIKRNGSDNIEISQDNHPQSIDSQKPMGLVILEDRAAIIEISPHRLHERSDEHGCRGEGVLPGN
jgi:hypothetical protein